MHLRTEGGVHDDSPVAEFVVEPLDHDRVVVGQPAGGLGLFGQVRQQVRGGPVVETCVEQPGMRSGLR